MAVIPGGTRIRHRGHEPRVHESAYVAPTATLVGDVVVGPRARVMFGAVLDAEGSRVEIGEATVIGENTVLRASAAYDYHQQMISRQKLLPRCRGIISETYLKERV